MTTRTEKDALGEKKLPKDALYGIHALRAAENFPVTGRPPHPILIRAFADVKKACAGTNKELGYLDETIADALIAACGELALGDHADHIIVDALQGGAGTSTNMNVNEIIANRATQITGTKIDPLNHANLHQSTNDTYPTALKVAALRLFKELEASVTRLQDALQKKEAELADTIKAGRTQTQDAVPVTLGVEFSAYAEAIARDRWRIYKCRERIKQINLGGTAIGTGLGAPRDYILKVSRRLREETGLNLARAENMVDATQNRDDFAEASGILKAYAVNLMKIAQDLRFLSSGPDAGIAEINLPALQAGSSIMPGKVNPVLPEAVIQTALSVMSKDFLITQTAMLGHLELNAFLPLLADAFLSALSELIAVTDLFTDKCITGITANKDRCKDLAENSTMLATVLVPALGYKKVEAIMAKSRKTGQKMTDILLNDNHLTQDALERLFSPRAMTRLGHRDEDFEGVNTDD